MHACSVASLGTLQVIAFTTCNQVYYQNVHWGKSYALALAWCGSATVGYDRLAEHCGQVGGGAHCCLFLYLHLALPQPQILVKKTQGRRAFLPASGS